MTFRPLFIILGLLFFVLVSSEDICANVERLPKSLDSVAYLGSNGEVHLFGQYFLNTSIQRQSLTFTIKQPSIFRVYLSPHYVDIDLVLFKNGKLLEMSSLKQSTEEMILANLEAASYKLDFIIFGATQPDDPCPTFTMELAIALLDQVSQGLSRICPDKAESNMPNLDGLEQLSTGKDFVFDSQSTTFYAVPTTPAGQTAILASYKLDVVKPPGRAGRWKLQATLGQQFIQSGSLGMMLLPATAPATLDQCQRRSDCANGVAVAMNQHSIITTLLNPTSAVNQSGSYMLHIYDNGYHNSTLFRCLPFTFALSVEHLDEDENPISCSAMSLPKSLNGPGLLDEEGSLQWANPLWLNPSSSHDVSKFTLTRPLTLFRAIMAPARVDLDLHLVNVDTGRVFASAMKYDGQEGLVSELPAGNYSFTVSKYGISQLGFCETAMLAIAMAPAPNASRPCSASENIPDLSDFALAMDAVGEYHLPNSDLPYIFNYNKVYAERVIVTQTVKVTNPTIVDVVLTSDLLLDDIEIRIETDTGNLIMYGERARLSTHLHASLTAGTSFNLTISTAPVQTSAGLKLTRFPECAEFFLQIRAQRADYFDRASCMHQFMLPSSLNNPAFLSDAQSAIHFAEFVLLPVFTSAMQTQRVKFTVAQESFMRLYIAPHRVDIDLRLEKEGQIVKTESGINTEESFVVILEPNKEYTLVFLYFDFSWQQESKPCEAFNLEWAIIPTTDIQPYQCPDTSLPPVTWLQSLNSSSQIFTFQQNSDTARVIPFPFELTEPTAFRAWASSSFATGDIGLRLYSPNASIPAHSVHDYNWNEIASTDLRPGCVCSCT